jgi:hypothetical protein
MTYLAVMVRVTRDRITGEGAAAVNATEAQEAAAS